MRETGGKRVAEIKSLDDRRSEQRHQLLSTFGQKKYGGDVGSKFGRGWRLFVISTLSRNTPWFLTRGARGMVLLVRSWVSARTEETLALVPTNKS